MCTQCGSLSGFKKLPNTFGTNKVIVYDYPGSKRFKAGYTHTHADRPAEKKGSQVSMHGSGGVKDKK